MQHDINELKTSAKMVDENADIRLTNTTDYCRKEAQHTAENHGTQNECERATDVECGDDKTGNASKLELGKKKGVQVLVAESRTVNVEGKAVFVDSQGDGEIEEENDLTQPPPEIQVPDFERKQSRMMEGDAAKPPREETTVGYTPPSKSSPLKDQLGEKQQLPFKTPLQNKTLPPPSQNTLSCFTKHTDQITRLKRKRRHRKHRRLELHELFSEPYMSHEPGEGSFCNKENISPPRDSLTGSDVAARLLFPDAPHFKAVNNEDPDLRTPVRGENVTAITNNVASGSLSTTRLKPTTGTPTHINYPITPEPRRVSSNNVDIAGFTNAHEMVNEANRIRRQFLEKQVCAAQETVRGKNERKKLIGFACHECEHFFREEANTRSDPEEAYQQLLNIGCRHRAVKPPPATPPDYWKLTFEETQTQPPTDYNAQI